jgi:hypothetical protein
MPETTLGRYYRAIDEDRIDDALAMLDADVRFLMVLPSGARRGRGRDDMATYLKGRGVPDRRHVALREAETGDIGFYYGKVTEGGDTTGRFLSGVRLGADGLIESYQVTFDTEHVLVEG